MFVETVLWSYGVNDDMGNMFFIEATKMEVTEEGRLLFWNGRRLVAAVDTGKWTRVLEGISLEDFEEEEEDAV